MKTHLTINDNLVRKQFLLSAKQVKKLSALSAAAGKSEAEVVRLAIDAFDPKSADTLNSPELMELALQRLNDAIKSTQQANKIVANALERLT